MSASNLAEELEKCIDVLLLDQDLRQSHYVSDQSPGEMIVKLEQVCPHQGEAAFYESQP